MMDQYKGYLDLVVALTALVAILVSVFGLYLQKKTSEEVGRQANKVQEWIHGNEATLQRRTSFFELWPHISKIDKTKPDEPIQAKVIESTNTLELAAICWEANVVDRELIKVSFMDVYIKTYDAISQISSRMPNGKTGPEILGDAPIIGKIYRVLVGIRQQAADISQ